MTAHGIASAAYRLGVGLNTTHEDYYLHLDARNRCAVCGTRYSLQYDHIVPLSRGGARLDPDNVQALCGRHHAVKTRRETNESQTVGFVQHQPMKTERNSFAF
ncbi:MAG: HNH endonuclease [Betaproteobacteria bacterium]|nr:HNH endonuclease [Betaproteobacteria bacterium]